MFITNFFNQIQLTLIYLLAYLDLFNNSLKELYLLETPLFFLINLLNKIKLIFSLEILNNIFNSNNIFIIVYIIFQLVIIKSIINLPKIIKYNISIVLILLLLQRIITMFLDTFLNTDILLINNSLIRKNFNISDKFLSLLTFQKFLIFFILYTYLFIISIFNKYPQLKFLLPLTNSIAFWLKLKTPNMKFGNF